MAVYILKAVGTPRIKIGWATDVASRIRSLKTGCPYPVELIATIESEDPVIERELHKLYREYRVHGEWFELPDKAIGWLKSAEDKDILRMQIASFLLGKDLSYVHEPSKVEQIRRDMSEVFSGCGA